MDIGKKIKQSREKIGISMTALAKKADVGQSSLSHIENNNRQPTFDVLERIIKALGFTLSEFFSQNDEEIPKISLDIQEIIDNAQKLTTKQRKALNRFLQSLIDE